MHIRPTAFALVVAGVVVAFAQSPPSGPTFDVVSIKRHVAQPGALAFGSTQNQRPDGGFTLTNIPAATLISHAYPPNPPADMVGLPTWAMSERYDVSATSTLTQASPEERLAMMRAMLADRFKLVVRIEPRERSVFDLVLAREDRKLGAGLTAMDVDCAAITAARDAEAARTATPPARQIPDFKLPPPPCTLRTIDATMRDRLGDGQGRLGALMEGEATMDSFAAGLRFSTGRLVVNKTTLPGSYRVRMNFDGRLPLRGPDIASPPDGPEAVPTIFTAIREQLGLKLESSRAQLDTLVIDRLERPTEN
jgi:uncharacterized protein (TIGR03435 family)